MSLGVYISYPFCSQKCTYCNFASGVFPKELEKDYLWALERELEGAFGLAKTGGVARATACATPDTLYVGGGTPSQMPAQALTALLNRIPGRPWAEATLEAAPGTITPERVDEWLQAGINRVSLGVQSFSTRELARTGRKHTPEIVQHEVELLRASGISNINIDLIAGLPGQTAVSWKTSLSWLTTLECPHVSVYMLEVDEDSRLGQEVLLNGKRFGAPEVPGDDRIAEMYETAVSHLRTMGIERYEISNFARPGSESLHNLKYWRLEPYLGFGSDAHSFDRRERWQNVESAAYVARMREHGSARLEVNDSNPDEEKFFVGLRLSEGVPVSLEDCKRWERQIEQFSGMGLLERQGGRLRLTDRGILYSNEVFAEFIEA